MLNLNKIVLVGCVAAVWLVGCSTPIELKMVNEGEQAVTLRSEEQLKNKGGYMRLQTGGTAYVHPYEGKVFDGSRGIAFIGDGGAGIKRLPGSTVWIDEIEMRIGGRIKIINPGPEVVRVRYSTPDGQERTLELGENEAESIDASLPFRLNGLSISPSNEFRDR